MIFIILDNYGWVMDSWLLVMVMGYEWVFDVCEVLELVCELMLINGVIIVIGLFYLIKELEEGFNDESLDC